MNGVRKNIYLIFKRYKFKPVCCKTRTRVVNLKMKIITRLGRTKKERKEKRKVKMNSVLASLLIMLGACVVEFKSAFPSNPS